MSVTFPLRLRPLGAKSPRFREDAARIVAYVNDDVSRRGPGEHMVAYSSIEHDLGLSYERVTDVLGPLGGGNTAIMVRMPGTRDT